MDLKENNVDVVKKNSVKEKILNIFSNYSMVIVLFLSLIIFQIATDGVFMKPLNITNLILQNSHILVLSIGMLMVVLLGDVDLSVGSLVALIGAISSILIIKYNIPTILGVIICLLLGALIGAWNGFWIAKVGIPSFIVTISGMLLFRGITQVLLQGTSIAGYPKSFVYLSTGYIPNIGGSEIHLTSILISAAIIILFVGLSYTNRKKRLEAGVTVESKNLYLMKTILLVAVIAVVTYLFASYQGFPFILILIVALSALYSIVTQKMAIGRHVYATGGNRKSAELSGINTTKVKFLVFVNMGVLAALAGLIL